MSDMRASDADREAAADALRAHHAIGRIDDEELEERVAAALAARTLSQLAALSEDLPTLARPATVVPADIPVGGYGLRTFHQRHDLRCDRTTGWRELVDHIVPRMAASGYTIVDRHEPELIVFARDERPWWVPLSCIFLFPFGLFALTVRNTERIVVSLDARGADRTSLAVSGTARRAVRKAFAGLSAHA